MLASARRELGGEGDKARLAPLDALESERNLLVPAKPWHATSAGLLTGEHAVVRAVSPWYRLLVPPVRCAGVQSSPNCASHTFDPTPGYLRVATGRGKRPRFDPQRAVTISPNSHS